MIMEITETFLQSLLDALKRDILSSLHTAMPGIILAYNASSGLASVQPALRRKTNSGAVLSAPVLYDVPVFLPAAEFAPSPGDPCILLFMDFCMDGWLESGQPVLPPSPRQHDLSDAIALAGFSSALPRTSA